MSCTSKLSSYVTMISNFFIINEFFTYPTSVSWLKLFFLFFLSHDQTFFAEIYFFFITILQYSYSLKNCFNKFKSSIFTPQNSNPLTKLVINTNKFVSKTKRNVCLNKCSFNTFLLLKHFKKTFAKVFFVFILVFLNINLSKL